MRAEIFLPKNGDEYTIAFCHPRKQLKEVRIPSLGPFGRRIRTWQRRAEEAVILLS